MDMVKRYGIQGLAVIGLAGAGLLFGGLGSGLFGGYVFSLGILAAFGCFAWDVCVKSGLTKVWAEFGRRELIFCALLLLAANAVLCFLISREHTIRFWDQAAYWKRAIRYMDDVFASPITGAKSIYYTIKYEDYNLIIPAILALPMKLTGISFLSYAFWIFNLFTLPGLFVLATLLVRMSDGKGSISFSFACALLMPLYLMIVLDGFLDSFSFLMTVFSFALLMNGRYYQETDVERSILTALCPLAALLGRRYFGYYVIGYVGAVLAGALAGPVDWKHFIKNFLLTGAVALVLLLFPFREFLKMNLFNDYQVSYSAYKLDAQVNVFSQSLENFGLWVMLLAVIGFALCIRDRDKRRFGVILAVQYVLALASMLMVMNIYEQQNYIVLASLTLLALYGGSWLGAHWKKGAYAVLAGILLVNFLYSFQVLPLPDGIKPTFPRQTRGIKTRTDLEQIEALARELNHLTQGNQKTAYCLASSDVLNGEILQHIGLPNTLAYVPALQGTHDVDLRDGFPISFLKADYVVVAEPIQYHLLPEGQRVIGLLAGEFGENGRLAGRYTRLQEYVLEDGVRAGLYRRDSNFIEEDYIYLQNLFDRYYGDYPELFHNRFNEVRNEQNR